jgi:hypothetical protein
MPSHVKNVRVCEVCNRDEDNYYHKCTTSRSVCARACTEQVFVHPHPICMCRRTLLAPLPSRVHSHVLAFEHAATLSVYTHQ